MSQSGADRNLLIGVLAVRMEFVTRDQLMDAMNVWTLNQTESLVSVLRKRSIITEDTQRLLTSMAERHSASSAVADAAGFGIDRSTNGSDASSIRHDTDQVVDAYATVAPVAKQPAEFREKCPLETAVPFPLMPTVQFLMDPLATAAPIMDRHVARKQMPIQMASTASRFRILRPHNAGGLGTVSVARDEELGREVALKEIKESYADHPESRRRFIVEAEITGCLEHPGIVPVYGLGQYADGRPYYAMRFIRGECLQDALDRFHQSKDLDLDPRRRLLELRLLLRRIVDVCNAMEYAHSRGVLHRDLKPDNVMLGKYGETLVVDWGLAKADHQLESDHREEPPLQLLSGAGSSSTQMGSCLGTPAYMSPEQASGRLDLIKPPSDVYSIGATLYTVLTGKLPFASDSLLALLQQVRDGEFSRPRAIDTRIPHALEAICLRAMATRVEDRYSTALALANDLERWLADESVSAYTEPIGNRIARWSRHHRALVTSVVACTIASLFILSLFIALLLAANSRERSARELADSERFRAESNLDVAKQAVATMLTEVGRAELVQYPQMEQTRSKLLARARSFYDEFLKQKPKDVALRYEVAVALRNLAEVDRLVDDHDQAEMRYIQSMDQLQALASEYPVNPTYRRQLALVQDDLGQLLRSRNAARAQEYYNESINLKVNLTSVESSADLLQELAKSFYNRGIVQAEQGNREAAQTDVLSAIGTLNNILSKAETPDPTVKQELARCYNNLGNLLQSSGNIKNAIAQFQKSLELLNELPYDRERQTEQAIYQNNLANLHRAMGDLENADSVSEAAIENLAKLAQPLPLVANELANAHHNRGIILSQRKFSEEAESEYDRAIEILTRLVANYPDVSLYRDRLGNSLFQVGSLQHQSHQDANAILNIERAMSEHRLALSQSIAEPLYFQHLKNDLVGLALIHNSQGNHAAVFETALRINTELVKDSGALFDSAQLIARCIDALEKDTSIESAEVRDSAKERYATQFRGTLDAAYQAGFHDLTKIDKARQPEDGAFYLIRKHRTLNEAIDRFRRSMETP